MNVWELEGDFNFEFKRIFSGVSVSVAWKLPTFLDGFFDRNTKKKSGESEKEASRLDAETLDSLKRVFKKY